MEFQTAFSEATEDSNYIFSWKEIHISPSNLSVAGLSRIVVLQLKLVERTHILP